MQSLQTFAEVGPCKRFCIIPPFKTVEAGARRACAFIAFAKAILLLEHQVRLYD